MKISFKNHRSLCLITDSAIAGISNPEIAKRAFSAGVRTIQLREKRAPKRDIFKDAEEIRKLALRYNATFIVNDYVDIALAVDADGLHLGQDDMPVKEARKILGKKKIIGVSTHSIKQAVKAQEEGADYIGFGPVFRTTTKDAGRPKGLKMLREVRSKVSIPIAAIGGITSETSSSLFAAGADVLAVSSAILSGDIEKNIRTFFEIMD